MSEKDFTNQRWSVSNLPKDLFAYFEKTFPIRKIKSTLDLSFEAQSTRGMDPRWVLILEANETYPRRAVPFHCIRSARYERQDEPDHVVSMDDVHETLRSAIKDVTDFIVKQPGVLEIPPPHTLLVLDRERPRIYADRRGKIVRVEAWLDAGVDLWTGAAPPTRQVPKPQEAKT